MKRLFISITATLACVGAFVQGKVDFDINTDNLIYLTFRTNCFLGPITDSPPGQFQFTDPQATNTSRRFYRVRSP